ncbi:MAG TPA: 1-deoxy-D-xylulose-5-phosphate reductoisomerase [Chloroflexota bacterium]
MARNVVLLGSTGSIGRQTLEVADELAGEIRIYGLMAHRNLELLEAQVARYKPAFVMLAGDDITGRYVAGEPVIAGDMAVAEAVSRPEVDLVVVGTAGKGGLLPTLAALRAGKQVAVANKETLVMAGDVIRSAMQDGGGTLIPIDSEHSAIWQCLQGEDLRSIERLTLTASGGALRHLAGPALEAVTPEQALRHPTWSMGRKITIDSANLMNKGLEVIEAHWLFDVEYDAIEVVLHPESIVHSLVTFDDSSTKAQLGPPDMRLPIQYALTHPERRRNVLQRLDLASTGALHFESIDYSRYPALKIAIQAGKEGATYPAVLCGADEVAVDAFLHGRIRFTDIPRVVEDALQQHIPCRSPDLADILEADRWACVTGARLVSRLETRS